VFYALTKKIIDILNLKIRDYGAGLFTSLYLLLTEKPNPAIIIINYDDL